MLCVFLAGALVGYLLPWIVAPSAPMSLNAYDLAEWVSLHPSQHHTTPPLHTSLLLRAHLAFLSVLFAIVSVKGQSRLVLALSILILAAAQLPPPEFVLDPGNLNYRQQFGLALTSLVAGLLLLVFTRRRLHSIVLVFVPLFGIIATVHGLSQAFEVYASLHTRGAIGLGPWILVAAYAGCTVHLASVFFRSRTQLYAEVD